MQEQKQKEIEQYLDAFVQRRQMLWNGRANIQVGLTFLMSRFRLIRSCSFGVLMNSLKCAK